MRAAKGWHSVRQYGMVGRAAGDFAPAKGSMSMQHKIVLRSGSDMTLATAERVAFDRAQVELGEEAVSLIGRGRVRFEGYLAKKGGYIYGSTTAPGSRAKVVLAQEAVERQGHFLGQFSRAVMAA